MTSPVDLATQVRLKTLELVTFEKEFYDDICKGKGFNIVNGPGKYDLLLAIEEEKDLMFTSGYKVPSSDEKDNGLKFARTGKKFSVKIKGKIFNRDKKFPWQLIVDGVPVDIFYDVESRTGKIAYRGSKLADTYQNLAK